MGLLANWYFQLVAPLRSFKRTLTRPTWLRSLTAPFRQVKAMFMGVKMQLFGSARSQQRVVSGVGDDLRRLKGAVGGQPKVPPK